MGHTGRNTGLCCRNNFMRRRPQQGIQRFYNRFSRLYGIIELFLGRTIEKIVRSHIKNIPEASEKTAVEYACGSGLLTIHLARMFKSVTAYDFSTGMLARASKRARAAGVSVTLLEGNITAPEEEPGSFDYVFVCFALHLFPPAQVELILRRLLTVARESVIVVDHGRTWNPAMAFIEWLEGSYYDEFIRIDFRDLAKKIDAAQFKESGMNECSIMQFDAVT